MDKENDGRDHSPRDHLRLARSIEGERIVVLGLSGELDVYTAPLLDEQLAGEPLDDLDALIVDVGSLVFLDSSGLRVLISAHSRLSPHGGKLVVRNAGSSTRRVIEIAGLDRSFVLEDPG